MKGKGLAWFAGFVALLTVYVFLDYHWEEKKKEKEKKGIFAFSLSSRRG